MRFPKLIIAWLVIWAFLAPAASHAAETSVVDETAAADYTILALGDSLTEGYQLKKQQAYPAQLEALLREEGYAVRVVNHGISGDTTAGGRARLNKALKTEPDLVIVALGANDFLRGLPPATTKANLEAIVQRLTEEEIAILLVGMKAPPNIGTAFQQRFDAIFPALAADYPLTLTYDFLTHVAGKAGLNLADGIHPNAQGYRIVAQNLLPVVKAIIEQERQARTRP